MVTLVKFFDSWVYGGFLAGLLLLGLSPILFQELPRFEFWCFILLPVYMVHQFEEHANDRFRTYVNTHVCRGLEGLTLETVFVANVPGVWGVILVSLLLSHFVYSGFALLAGYLVLVNAIVHIIGFVATRKYNPGLVTSVFLFIPTSVLLLTSVARAGYGSFFAHAMGFSIALLIHLAIMVAVMTRVHRLSRHES